MKFFFFNDTATTEIYTLSLHDALPISQQHPAGGGAAAGDHRARPRPGLAADGRRQQPRPDPRAARVGVDRKSTRLKSSHANISYAVFCLKKKETLDNISDLPLHNRVDL